MATLTAAETRKAAAFAELVYGNPFLPSRIDAERTILSSRFTAGEAVWSRAVDFEQGRPNVAALQAEAETLVQRWQPKSSATNDESFRRAFVDVACYVLYYRYHDELLRIAETETAERPAELKAGVWQSFRDDYGAFFQPEGRPSICPYPAEHLIALLFQTRRAFVHVFGGLFGSSEAAARLRAEIWHSIFTHDRRRYSQHLWSRMNDLATLITGQSGTGKEVVASSIARSQYRAFDTKSRRFAPMGVFAALNLAAIPVTLVESELFGHKRGSFTGAAVDRQGWLEMVGVGGCVFLDEVGDVPTDVQVKLLRVLQGRTFSRVGETTQRRFEGKIIAATNRDLATDIGSGHFRHDLYYRLAGDMIRTPTLREQTSGDVGELEKLVDFVAARLIPEDREVRGELVAETMTCIERDLGLDYTWPGNFRELEQCVRNVLVRKCYTPPTPAAPAGMNGELMTHLADRGMTVDELTTRYVAAAYAQAGTYEATARRLGIDRRTVKARVEAAAAL